MSSVIVIYIAPVRVCELTSYNLLTHNLIALDFWSKFLRNNCEHQVCAVMGNQEATGSNLIKQIYIAPVNSIFLWAKELQAWLGDRGYWDTEFEL